MKRPDSAAFDHSRTPRPYWALGIFFVAIVVDGWRGGGLWLDGALTWAVLECGWYLWRLFKHNRWYSWRAAPKDQWDQMMFGPRVEPDS